jgi:hypothetical protein
LPYHMFWSIMCDLARKIDQTVGLLKKVTKCRLLSLLIWFIPETKVPQNLREWTLLCCFRETQRIEVSQPHLWEGQVKRHLLLHPGLLTPMFGPTRQMAWLATQVILITVKLRSWGSVSTLLVRKVSDQVNPTAQCTVPGGPRSNQTFDFQKLRAHSKKIK